jgi:hypothetical protein
MPNQFDPTLGALIPEDVVYEILTMSGHGNWRGSKFMYRIPADDPRRAILRTIPPVQSVKFFVDISGNGFTGATYDYFVRLNDRYEIATAEFYGDRQKMIRYYVLKDNVQIHCEQIYCDYYTRTKTS